MSEELAASELSFWPPPDESATVNKAGGVMSAGRVTASATAVAASEKLPTPTPSLSPRKPKCLRGLPREAPVTTVWSSSGASLPGSADAILF